MENVAQDNSKNCENDGLRYRHSNIQPSSRDIAETVSKTGRNPAGDNSKINDSCNFTIGVAPAADNLRTPNDPSDLNSKKTDDVSYPKDVQNPSFIEEEAPQVTGKSQRSASFNTADTSRTSQTRDERRSSYPRSSQAKDEKRTSFQKTEDAEFQLHNMSLGSYLYTELTRGYWLENEEAKFAEKRERIYTFMRIPRELEKFMTYGFFQCIDAFLYLFTFLPLRFLVAFSKLTVRGCLSSCVAPNGRILEPAQICDLLKVVILVFSIIMMNYVDISMMYHLIRGQAIIKLYIFFNMLEVADRLFTSFGQDILDALFWTATEPRGRRRDHFGVIPHLILAIVYVFLHACLVLFQSTTLNVAFNSHNKALLTIMMSNNFVELKGSVFKKFDRNNLFQMSCSDVRERFHFVVLLAVVCVRNLTEFSWNMEHFWILVPDVVMVMLAEYLVDWVKHAFITKFNEIPSEVYQEFTVSIAYDMAAIRKKNSYSDHLDMISRRMGFIPLPLAVLLVRIVWQSVEINTWTSCCVLALFYLCLVSFKVLNSIILLGKAYGHIKKKKEQKAKEAATKRAQYEKKKRKSAQFTHSNLNEKEVLTPTPSTDTIKRSQSFGAKMNVSFMSSPECEGVSRDLSSSTNRVEDLSSLGIRGNLPSKDTMSVSTVSLESVCLNEDFLKDSGVGVEKPEAKPKKPTIPLHEVDRFTMAGSSIV